MPLWEGLKEVKLTSKCKICGALPENILNDHVALSYMNWCKECGTLMAICPHSWNVEVVGQPRYYKEIIEITEDK